MSVVLTKSPKGSREANGRTNDLPEHLRALLQACRGRFTVDAKCAEAPLEEREKMAAALADLIAGGYLRPAAESWLDDASAPPDAAEDDMPEEAEETEDEVDEAAQRLRSDVAGRRGQRDERTSELVKQIDEAARLKADEKARIEAEEKARREAEAKLRREAEEKARCEAEENARIEAAEKARIEADERARREEEEAQRLAREERKRLKAEKKAREEALEKARLEQEERDREALRERMRLRAEKRRKAILPLFLGLLLPVALGMLLLQVLPFDGKRSEFETSAAVLFGVPVKAGSTRFGLLAGPQWIISDVVIGSDASAVRIARVRLGMSWLGVFGAPLRFESIHLERPQLPAAVALMLLHRESGETRLQSSQVIATGMEFLPHPNGMPPLNLHATFSEGRLTKISGGGQDAESGKLSLDMRREDQWRLTAGASQVRWLLSPDLPLTDVALTAELMPDALLLKEFSASLFSGEIGGSGRLSWRDGWRAAAKVEARRLDPAKIAPGWILEGGINGKAVMAAEAAKPGELQSHLAVSGSFDIGRGLLKGLDLDKLLQNRGQGEQFRFESLSGDFAAESRRVELSNLKLVAPELKAGGALTIEADRSASGRIVVEANAAGSRRTANLKVTGTLAAPSYQR